MKREGSKELRVSSWTNRKSPIGLPVPEALKKLNLEAGTAEALNRVLQEAAWDAVIHHPLSGVKAP
ncbi:MAG: hypothetical protein WDN28_06190 [Chthoniobacter sp.]